MRKKPQQSQNTPEPAGPTVHALSEGTIAAIMRSWRAKRFPNGMDAVRVDPFTKLRPRRAGRRYAYRPSDGKCVGPCDGGNRDVIEHRSQLIVIGEYSDLSGGPW